MIASVCFLSFACFKIEDHRRLPYAYYVAMLFSKGVMFWSDFSSSTASMAKEARYFWIKCVFLVAQWVCAWLECRGTQDGVGVFGGCRWSFSNFFFFRPSSIIVIFFFFFMVLDTAIPVTFCSYLLLRRWVRVSGSSVTGAGSIW